jgi:hypothetical protein
MHVAFDSRLRDHKYFLEFFFVFWHFNCKRDLADEWQEVCAYHKHRLATVLGYEYGPVLCVYHPGYHKHNQTCLHGPFIPTVLNPFLYPHLFFLIINLFCNQRFLLCFKLLGTWLNSAMISIIRSIDDLVNPIPKRFHSTRCVDRRDSHVNTQRASRVWSLIASDYER